MKRIKIDDLNANNIHIDNSTYKLIIGENIEGIEPYNIQKISCKLGHLLFKIFTCKNYTQQEFKEVSANLPIPVNNIINHLITIQYENLYGCYLDLKECYTQWITTGNIQNFEIGSNNLSLNLTIPDHLYGREEEVNELEIILDKVKLGSSELVFITGESGIGKTELVNTGLLPLIEENGLILSGKFNQDTQEVPYTAIIQALRNYFIFLLKEKPDYFDNIKQTLSNTLYPGGEVLSTIIPELNYILEKQSLIVDLPPKETQYRFSFLFGLLFRILSDLFSPIVIFLDDLQWADESSLNFIKNTLLNEEYTNMLIICAYREESLSFEKFQQNNFSNSEAYYTTINLSRLHTPYINQLLSDTLHCKTTELTELATSLYEKTLGNPLYLREYLFALQENGILEFNLNKSKWEWSLNDINKRSPTKNVVDLLITRLDHLLHTTRKTLNIAACLGISFNLQTLSIACKQDPDILLIQLSDAIQKSLVIPVNKSTNINTQSFKSHHDRIKEAVLNALSKDTLQRLQASIVDRLLDIFTDKQIEDNIFLISNLINIGYPDNFENIDFMKFNYQVGEKAMQSAAYNSAVYYYKSAIKYLPDNPWSTAYNYTKRIYINYGVCLYVLGDQTQAEEIFNNVFSRLITKREKAEHLNQKMLLGSYVGNDTYCIGHGLEAMSYLGIKISRAPTIFHFIFNLIKAKIILGQKKPYELINLHDIETEDSIFEIELLGNLLAPAYFYDKKYFSYLVLILFHKTIRLGNSEFSYFSYVTYGLILSAKLNQLTQGYEFGKLALKMVSLNKKIKYKGRAIMVFGAFIKHWIDPVDSCLPVLNTAYDLCMKEGDFNYAGYILDIKLFFEFVKGEHLDAIL